MNLHSFDERNPPLQKGQTRSENLLCLVQTPSTRFWIIGYYDGVYRKDSPWRDIFNCALRRVTHYCELPDMPEKEN